MKVFLLFRDSDFDPEPRLPPNADDLVQDLELATLQSDFFAMAASEAGFGEPVPYLADQLQALPIVYPYERQH